MKWQLNRLLHPVYNLGPGQRIAIWTQGCSIRCQGCLSPSLWEKEGGRAIEVDTLFEKIFAVAFAYDGISISGGEPFDQYQPMMEFCEKIKEQTELDIYVFSGYTLRELDQIYPDKRFRTCIDFLVDGRYDIDQTSTESWRGSSNQSLYQLFPEREVRCFPSKAVENPWSMAISETGDLFLSGIPAVGDLEKIESALQKKGVSVTFQ